MAFDHDNGGATGGGGGRLDLFTLMGIDTSKFITLGFHDADAFASNAADFFEDVERVVTGGVAWTGEGQPQASVVMRSNAAAWETARAQMRAGITTMDALATAIEKAQSKANAIVSTQVGYDVDLRDYLAGAGASVEIQTNAGPAEIFRDGRVFLTTHEEPVAVPANQAKLESVLTYARSADLTAAHLLSRINAVRPVFSATATGKTLAYNQTLHTVAETNRIFATIVKRTWNELGPFDWEPLPDRADWSWTRAAFAFVGLPYPSEPSTLSPRDAALELYAMSNLKNASKRAPVIGLPFSIYDALEAGSQRPDPYPGPKGVRTPFDDIDAEGDILKLKLLLVHHSSIHPADLGALEGGDRDFDKETQAFIDKLEAWQNGTWGHDGADTETRHLDGWEQTFRKYPEELSN